MTPLTSEKIAELERLLAAATAGPWELHECVSECRDTYLNMTGAKLYRICDNDPWGDNEVPGDADMRLIAAAVNALPALLSLAKRVAGAPVGEVAYICTDDAGAECHVYRREKFPAELIDKRVALVEIVGGEEPK